MNFEHVRTFLEVAETGNFHRAAENLNVTQSTVSSRIQALEFQVGRPLVSRSRAGSRLTTAGLRFLPQAQSIAALWHKSQQTVTLRPEFRGVLSIGAQVSLWERLVLDWMVWMRQEAPDIALNIQADYSPAQMQKLSEGLLDVGVMYQPRHVTGLVVEKLLDEELLLVGTEDRDVSAEWVEDYIFVDWGDVFLGSHATAFPDTETAAITVGLGALGLQYILRNGGSGYFPVRVVQPLIEEGKLFVLNGAPTLQRPAYLVYRTDPFDKATLDIAIDGLRSAAAQA